MEEEDGDREYRRRRSETGRWSEFIRASFLKKISARTRNRGREKERERIIESSLVDDEDLTNGIALWPLPLRLSSLPSREIIFTNEPR